ncbi:MAG: dihydropteroate synthase [Planctomycetes bacterium]|nr:dihydropteroate synthase [Planctomycetota bacterium]
MKRNDLEWRFRCAKPIPKSGKTLIMGIVNLTPDSFYDGGRAANPHEAMKQALAMLAAGADIIDFGAESSRPGASAVQETEEIHRLGNIVALLRAETDAPISIDTYQVGTASHALKQGADMVNDITALRGGWNGTEGESGPMAELAARENAHVILMHMPSPPASMQETPRYVDAMVEITGFLAQRATAAERAGISKENIWLDPGFGFGKTFSHNREILLRLGEFTSLGYPLAVGLSRKRLIADALGLPPDERLEASLALAVMAAWSGADIVRVHDVKATVRAVSMLDAIRFGQVAK